MDGNDMPSSHDATFDPGANAPPGSPLRRRAILSAAGLAGAFALTRFVPAREPGVPVRDPSTLVPRAAARSVIDGALDSRLDDLKRKIASTTEGVCEPRIPITALPSSAHAQFVITLPGAYYLPGNLTQKSRKVCIDIQSDHVDIDGRGFVFVGGGRRAASCIRASGRTGIEIRNCAFKEWRGACCDMADCDDVYLRDVLVHACSSPPGAGGGAAIRCRDRCGIEDVSISSCSGGRIEMGRSSSCFRIMVADVTGGAIRCADECSIKDCRFVRVGGDVIVTGSGSVIARCECVAGSGCAFRCAEECRIESCTVMRRDARAIECGSRSSIVGNRVVLSWGIACEAESCCFDNELSSCSGGPDGPEGPGGAIVLRGGRSVCRRNSISSSRVGISVHRGGASCHVHENIVLDAGGGFGAESGPPGGIVIHEEAAGCVCTCNHVGAPPGVDPYSMGASLHGPIARAAGGDISFVRAASHPLVNTAT